MKTTQPRLQISLLRMLRPPTPLQPLLMQVLPLLPPMLLPQLTQVPLQLLKLLPLPVPTQVLLAQKVMQLYKLKAAKTLL